MTETIHIEERKVDGQVELIAHAHFRHEFRDDPHDDEAITAIRVPAVTPEIRAMAENKLRKFIADHKAGDIR